MAIPLSGLLSGRRLRLLSRLNVDRYARCASQNHETSSRQHTGKFSEQLSVLIMSAELIIRTETAPENRVALGAVYQIGRGPGNDLIINDNRASRNHAEIRLKGDKLYYLVDLGSSNGTMLNGRRVTIPSALKSGDEFQIASHTFQFIDSRSTQKLEIPSDQPDAMQTQMHFTSSTVSILVVDIRNYTGLSESIPADDLSQTVGKWFKEVDLIVQSQGGSIDKFIGDAVMAFWQKATTETDLNYIIGPIQTAQRLIELAKLFDSELSSRHPGFGFKVGCGLHTGRAIMGNIGVDNRPEFTAVGDCVNVAFRLESLCKELNQCIILSEEVKAAASDAFQFKDLGLQKVKGKAQEMRVFTLR